MVTKIVRWGVYHREDLECSNRADIIRTATEKLQEHHDYVRLVRVAQATRAECESEGDELDISPFAVQDSQVLVFEVE